MSQQEKVIHYNSPEAATLRTFVDVTGHNLDESLITQETAWLHQAPRLQFWEDRTGRLWPTANDPRAEHMARWCGCTHVNCSRCGVTISKDSTICPACHLLQKQEKHAERLKENRAAIPSAMQWLYSDTFDQYVEGIKAAQELAAEEGVTVAALALYFCDPNHAQELDADDFFRDDLPEDGDVPDELSIAAAEFNAKVEAYGHPLSFSPNMDRAALVPEPDPS